MIGTIVEIIFVLATHAAVGIYSSERKYCLKTTYIIWLTWVVVQGTVLLCVEFVLTKMPMQFFLGFILPLLGQYVIFFATTKGRNLQRIFTILTYSIFFCIAMTLFQMIKGTFGVLHPVFAVFLQAVMLLAVVGYFLRGVCPRCRVAARNISTGWGPMIFVNVVFLITVILSSIFPARLTSFRDPDVAAFLFLSISIMAVYPIIFSGINSLSEVATKREVERQNRLLLAQIQAENTQLAADRQARHDRRHHNLVMLEFANNNDIDSIREYLKGLVDSDTAAWSDSRHCDNMTVNTVLSVYERRAREQGIYVKIAANVSRDLNVTPQDMVIVIANIFENAIHAAAVQAPDRKFIDIFIKDSANRLLIKVENSCKENWTFEESMYGVGIHSVITAAEKYEGMYDFTAEDGVFSAKISLNLR